MPTRAEVDAQAQANADVVAMALEDLADGWAALGLTPAVILGPAAPAVITDLLANVVAAWGDVAATVAAGFYDQIRDQADLGGSFTAITTDPVSDVQLSKTSDWVIHQVYRDIEKRAAALKLDVVEPSDEDVAKVLQRLEGPAQRLVRQAGRDAIAESVRLDPGGARYARVPTGEETCAFCVVMASRGAVYRSAESAGDSGGEFNDYHMWCDCEAVPVFDGQDLPEGYDPGAYYEVYERAGKDLGGTTDLKKILAQMRRNDGLR